MKLLYVAGKYRGKDLFEIQENIHRAKAVEVELLKMGFAVICPHMNTALLDGCVPDDVFLRMDIVIMKRCDGVVFIPGWNQSSGARNEHKICKEEDIPVYYWPHARSVLEVVLKEANGEKG